MKLHKRRCLRCHDWFSPNNAYQVYCRYCEEKILRERKRKRKTESDRSLNQLAKEAAECGLSYGYYVAALRAGKTYEELRAAHLKNEFIERRRELEDAHTHIGDAEKA